MSRFVFSLKSAALAAVLGGAGSAQAADVRTGCEDIHATDASVAVRYTHTVARATFDVSFKAPPAAEPGLPGTLLVRVEDRPVGVLFLSETADGSLRGSLSFDSYANAGFADATVIPFPPTWPGRMPPDPLGVSGQARVEVGPLGCVLSG